MRKIIKTILIVFASIACLYYGAIAAWNHAFPPREPLDPACFEMEILRIELGGRIYAFPRKILGHVLYENMPVGKPEASRLEEICQKADDPIIKGIGTDFNIRPNACKPEIKENCNNRIHIGLTSIDRPLPNIDETDEMLTKRFTRECLEKNYFDTCKHWFVWKNLSIQFHYYLSAYPLEEIENTLRLVKQSIEQYEIQPEEQN